MAAAAAGGGAARRLWGCWRCCCCGHMAEHSSSQGKIHASLSSTSLAECRRDKDKDNLICSLTMREIKLQDTFNLTYS